MGHVIDWLVKLPPTLVLVAVFVVPLLESSAFVGFIFPGEVAVLIGGVVANEGALPLWSVIVLAAAGAIVGDGVGYEIGKHYGEGLLTRLPKRIVKPGHIERTKELLRRRGGRAVFIGRFTAALRVLVPGMAGIARLRYRSFLLFNALGGIAWAAETAVVGYLAGKSFRAAEHRLSIIGFGILALIVGGYLLHRLRRHPRVAPYVDARLSTERWTGRPLTLTVVAVGLSAWLFGGVLQDVVGQDGIALDDPRWHRSLIGHRIAWLSELARVVTYLGSTPVVYAVLIAAAMLAVRRRRYWEAALAVAALIVGQLIRGGISVLVGRDRPPRADWLTSASGYPFPSGHSTNAVLAWGLVVALLWPWLAGRGHRAAAIGGAVIVGLAVGGTRAYLGVHWPSDVLGGWALGCLLVSLAVTGLSLLRFHSQPTPEYRRSRQPSADPRTVTYATHARQATRAARGGIFGTGCAATPPGAGAEEAGATLQLAGRPLRTRGRSGPVNGPHLRDPPPACHGSCTAQHRAPGKPSHELADEGCHPGPMHKPAGLVTRPPRFPLPIDIDDADERRQANRAVGWGAVGLAITGLIELAIALLSGSVGLLGDALHNLSDVSTSLVVFLGFRISRRVATERYPYGYERAEDLAGVGIAIVIWASAVLAGVESIRKLLTHGTTSHVGWGIAGAAVGIAGNQLVARYKLRVGRRISSATLIADARHSWLDALSSAGALLGLVGVLAGARWADPVAGLVVTLFICHVGWEVTSDVTHRLMDGVDPEIITGAEALAMRIEGVRHAHARARWTGRTLRLELEAWLDADTTVATSDTLGRQAADLIARQLPDVRSLTWTTRAV